MKLKIADKWKWVAKDSDGDILWYTERPILNEHCWIRSSGGVTCDLGVLQVPDLGPWQNSLHEILPDGSLRKHVERPDLKVDDRVLTKYLNVNTWVSRHFAGWSEDGEIRCWVDGRTSWTTSPDDWRNWTEWKLPEDEQK